MMDTGSAAGPQRPERAAPDELELTLERAETLVARAQKAFETTVQALEDAVRALKSMPETGEGEIVKDVRAMNNALMLAMEMQEKARVAGSRHFGTGAGNGGSGRLDLEAARAEIAERLARLRAAGVADRVP
ncbi:hypothetical protein N8I71_10905 [Roseibacterium sp. SDUM158016]|uniref:hypothetical protein n=1 Tax=Roseicyclus sediminis TaxID=2980997 RepID=UPI0021CE045C|nr:hypothetical protein [Roseibacterium sp. SDUM158016]MCU4653345.1 hypothetical protein [Roseibacterium sp. SDUM158016]